MFGIDIPDDTKVYVVHDSVDFRCGIDRLVATCATVLKKDAARDGLFMFRNRHSNSLKILFYDGDGYWLCLKRLSKSHFKTWPKTDETLSQICMTEIVDIIKPKSKKQASTMPWLKIT